MLKAELFPHSVYSQSLVAPSIPLGPGRAACEHGREKPPSAPLGPGYSSWTPAVAHCPLAALRAGIAGRKPTRAKVSAVIDERNSLGFVATSGKIKAEPEAVLFGPMWNHE